MSGWSKDPETGKPNFIPADKADDVSLYTVADLTEEEAAKGIRSPGWVFYKEHARANGHIARRSETLVSFRGSNTMGGAVPQPDVAPSVDRAISVSPLALAVGQTGTVSPATFNGRPNPTVTTTLTLNGNPVQLGPDMTFVAAEGTYAATSTGTNRAGSANSSITVTVQGEQPVSEYLAPDAKVLFSGHSMIDAIFKGEQSAGVPSNDATLWRLCGGDQAGSELYRRRTIPGSPIRIRWEQQDGDGVAPLDFANPWSPVLEVRDMNQFDAFVITEGGPFSPPLRWEGTNIGWQNSLYYMKQFFDVCDANNTKKYFWTFSPALDVESNTWTSEGLNPDLPRFLAFMEMYGRSAEDWAAQFDDVKIIPGHVLWTELWTRAENGQLPGISGIEDLLSDNIHPNYIGSIFNAVFVHRFLRGTYFADADIQTLLDYVGTNITVAMVKSVCEVALAYEQGAGIDLQIGTYVPSGYWLDFSQDIAAQGFNVEGNFAVGTPVADNVGVWRDLGPEERPEAFYALMEVTMGVQETPATRPFVAAFVDGSVDNEWTVKHVGLLAFEDQRNMYFADGTGETNLSNGTDTHPFDGVTRGWVECYDDTNLMNLRDPTIRNVGNNLVQGGSHMPNVNHFGINYGWINEERRALSGNFTIHRGYIYTTMPSVEDRLRLQAMFYGFFDEPLQFR